MRHRYIIGMIISLWMLLISGCGSDTTDQQQAAMAVDVAPVKQTDFPINLDLIGNVMSKQTVRITSRFDSQIMDILFQEGDIVAAGQTLFILDDRTLQASLKQAEALLHQQKATARLAAVDYARGKTLFKQHYISKEQLDKLETSLQTAEAQTKQTQAQIDSITTQLTYTIIKSPITGQAGTINITRGNNVKANDVNELVTIHQINPIKIQLSIPQLWYWDLQTALQQNNATILLKKGNDAQILKGKLTYIENEIDPTTRNLLVWADIDNSDALLWPGMFVSVSLQLGTLPKALTVPLAAVQTGQQGNTVFVVRDGKIVIEPIKLLQTGAHTAAVTGNIRLGESVVINGFLKLKAGTLVTPNVETDRVPGNAS